MTISRNNKEIIIIRSELKADKEVNPIIKITKPGLKEYIIALYNTFKLLLSFSTLVISNI